MRQHDYASVRASARPKGRRRPHASKEIRGAPVQSDRAAHERPIPVGRLWSRSRLGGRTARGRAPHLPNRWTPPPPICGPPRSETSQPLKRLENRDVARGRGGRPLKRRLPRHVSTLSNPSAAFNREANRFAVGLHGRLVSWGTGGSRRRAASRYPPGYAVPARLYNRAARLCR